MDDTTGTDHSAHCFHRPRFADEHYLFPVRFPPPVRETQSASVMIEYLDDGELIIAARRLPGVYSYFVNYPDVVAEDEKLKAEHENTRERVETALEMLDAFNPQTYTLETASGNKLLSAIWVQVPEQMRDDVLVQMWQMLNYLREEYIAFLEEWEPEKVYEYVREHQLLEHEVAEIVD
ncbi:hypothetical protein [Halovenus salina]|uniref:Uncharacterized protein n=1 Tax=Halovenus salina TaxID=1510225 RepID=A0ABD5W4Q6_9EURY|nr:hypothetical protein [Halovenus salina]